MYWFPDYCLGRFIFSPALFVSALVGLFQKWEWYKKKVTFFCLLLCFECHTFTMLLLYFWQISAKIIYLCGSGSQLGSVFCLPGVFGKVWKHFWLSWGGVVLQAVVGRDQRYAAKHPTMHRTGTTTVSSLNCQ